MPETLCTIEWKDSLDWIKFQSDGKITFCTECTEGSRERELTKDETMVLFLALFNFYLNKGMNK